MYLYLYCTLNKTNDPKYFTAHRKKVCFILELTFIPYNTMGYQF